jgi:hypothetical protein
VWLIFIKPVYKWKLSIPNLDTRFRVPYAVIAIHSISMFAAALTASPSPGLEHGPRLSNGLL